MSTVVVSTHLDDAVLSCYRELGPETIVVTVFAGIPPPGEPGSWDRRTGATDSTARMRERRTEDIEALALSGSRAVHLDLLTPSTPSYRRRPRSRRPSHRSFSPPTACSGRPGS